MPTSRRAYNRQLGLVGAALAATVTYLYLTFFSEPTITKCFVSNDDPKSNICVNYPASHFPDGPRRPPS